MTLINVTPGKEQSKVFRLQTKLIQSSTLVQALLKTVWLHDKVSKNLPLIHSVTLHGVLLLWQWTLLLQSSWALNSFQSRSAGAVVQNLPRPAHAICLKWLSALIRGSFKWTAHGSWVGVSLMVGRGGKRREWENKGRTEVSSSHDRELLAVFMSSLRKQKLSPSLWVTLVTCKPCPPDQLRMAGFRTQTRRLSTSQENQQQPQLSVVPNMNITNEMWLKTEWRLCSGELSHPCCVSWRRCNEKELHAPATPPAGFSSGADADTIPLLQLFFIFFEQHAHEWVGRSCSAALLLHEIDPELCMYIRFWDVSFAFHQSCRCSGVEDLSI